MKIHKDVVKYKRPGWNAYADKIRFWRDCYTGGGGFGMSPMFYKRNGKTVHDTDHTRDDAGITYLTRHIREHKEAFDRRIKAAVYHNYLRETVVDILKGYVTKERPRREHYPEWATDWISDCTRDGKDFDTVISDELLPYGFVYGRLPVKIDSDYVPGATTQADRVAAGARDAYIETIHPDAIMDWQRDEDKHYVWIKYMTSSLVSEPLKPAVKVSKWVWLTGDEWWAVERKGKAIDEEMQWDVTQSSKWPVVFPGGVCPVTEVIINDGESYMEDLGPVCMSLFNLHSELRTMEGSSCFPVLLYPEETPGNVKNIVVGPMNALPFSANGKHKPELMSFDSGPYQHYLERIEAEIKKLKEIGGTSTVFGSDRETAAALLVKFGNTDRKIATIAKGLADAERRILKIVAAWKGQKVEDADVTPIYPSTFEAMDQERVQTAMEILDQIAAPKYILGEAIKKLVGTLFPNAEPEKRESMEEEIDKWVTEDRGADESPDETMDRYSQTPSMPERPDARTP